MKNGFLSEYDYIPEPERSDIDNTVLSGQKYISSHRPAKTPLTRILSDQLKYLSPAIWALQLIALAAVNYFCLMLPGKTDGFRLMLAVVPVIALMNVPELIKDVLYDMSELERSTRIGSGTVMLMRLLIISMADILVISFAAITASVLLKRDFFTLLFFALIAYNTENMICLGAVRLFNMRGRNSAVCLCAAVSVTMTMLASCVSGEDCAFLAENVPVLAAAAAVTALLFVIQIIFMIKKINFRGFTNEN